MAIKDNRFVKIGDLYYDSKTGTSLTQEQYKNYNLSGNANLPYEHNVFQEDLSPNITSPINVYGEDKSPESRYNTSFDIPNTMSEDIAEIQPNYNSDLSLDNFESPSYVSNPTENIDGVYPDMNRVDDSPFIPPTGGTNGVMDNVKDFYYNNASDINNVGTTALHFGASILDNIEQNKLNDEMLAKGVPNPDFLNPLNLDTTFDVSSQLAGIADAQGETSDVISKYSTDSSIAANRIAASNIKSGQTAGSIMTDKFNKEVQLRNEEALRNKEIERLNLQSLDDYKMNQFNLETQHLMNKGANMVNLSEDIVSGIDRYNMNRYQQDLLDLEADKYAGSSEAHLNTLQPLELKAAYHTTKDPVKKKQIEAIAKYKNITL